MVIAREGRLSVRDLPSADWLSIIHWLRNSGKCFSTGSLRASLPSSIRIITPVAVTGLVIDMIWKIESVRIGFLLSRSW